MACSIPQGGHKNINTNEKPQISNQHQVSAAELQQLSLLNALIHLASQILVSLSLLLLL